MDTALLDTTSSPRVLTRMLEAVSRGIRTRRGLQEALGISGQAVRAHVCAGAFLSLLEATDPVTLSDLGLAYVYGGEERRVIYARAARKCPLVADILDASGDALPDVEEIAVVLRVREPELEAPDLQQRAGALRRLIAPAVGIDLSEPPLSQLSLPVRTHPPAQPDRPLQSASGEHDPEAYRYMLSWLLDCGELSLGHIRALIDAAGASALPIGGLLELALLRGDAVRVGDHIIATAGAVERSRLLSSTSALLLSDPGYRAYLGSLSSGLRPSARSDSELARYRRWDRILFGRGLPPEAIAAELERKLLDPSLSGAVLAGAREPVPMPESAPFLSLCSRQGLRIALPRATLALRGGLAAVSRALRAPRGSVALPEIGDRPLVVHTGLVHPGEPTPRVVPDMRSLRNRLISRAPYVSIAAAALWLHRVSPERLLVCRDLSGPVVRREGGSDMPLLDFMDAFAYSRGWLPIRGERGMDGVGFVEVLEAIGVASVLTSQIVLCEGLFVALQGEAEEMQLRAGVAELADAIDAFSSEHP